MMRKATLIYSEKYSTNYSVATALIAVCALLSGCASTPTFGIKKINIAIPVSCQEQVPERPVMPTEALQPGVAPWVLLRAALAEIDRRQAYELVMRAALVACTAPVAVAK